MMLVVRLAAESQGFARDLHDEAAAFLAMSAAPAHANLANTLQLGMTSDRALNKSNAGADTLARDFARIGLIFWPAIIVHAPQQGAIWKAELTKLIEMRNAIAHANEAKVLELEAQGFVLSRTLIDGWHRTLDLLTATMDDVVASYLGALLGVPRPW